MNSRAAGLDLTDVWALVDRLADAAAEQTLPLFRSTDLTTESKTADFDPVTEADRAAEAAIRTVLAEARPDDGILGEEHACVAGTSGLTWVIDPIDGTRGYISGTPTWGTLIALSDAQGPILGVVDQPYIGERFYGGPDRAEMTGPRGKRPLRTRGARPLTAATLFTTFPEVGTAEDGRLFRAVADRVRLVRYGTDCYAYALLAAGQIDLVIEAGLNPYDIHGPMAVVEAAGGIVTDWAGGPAHGGGRAIAAANAEVHGAALALLTGG